jgi:hypothetical protein
MKQVIAYIMLAVVLIGSGCMGTLSENLTPGNVDKDVVEYVEEAGVGHAEDYEGILYPSLAEVRRLNQDLDAAIALTDQELKHIAEQKKLKDRILLGTVGRDLELAVAREDFLFNPTTGAIALGLSLLGVGAGGYLGLMRKRPQDMTPEEIEAAMVEVQGDISDNQRSLISIVKSIQNVIDAETEPEKQAVILKILKDCQTPEARTAVKEAKAKL